MTIEQSIEQDVDILKNDEEKLYSYLSKLAYSERLKNIQFLESIYKSFINDSRDRIKSVAIYQLLISLHSTNPEYKNIALSEIKNTETDVATKLDYVFGLCDAYKGTFDKQLISVMYQLFKDTDEDEDLRTQSFEGLMKLMGMTTLDIINKNNNTFILNFKNINTNLFGAELNKAKEITNQASPS